jgi:hypothetical protein
MTEPEQPKQPLTDLQSIIVPVILAFVLVYFALPQYNDSELRQQNVNLTARLDLLQQTKADTDYCNGQYSTLSNAHGNLTGKVFLMAHDFDLFGIRLNSSEMHLSQDEGNISEVRNALSSGLAAANADIDNKVTGLQNADTQLAVNMTAMQAAVSSIVLNQSNQSEAIYTLIIIQGYHSSNISSINGNLTYQTQRIDNLTRAYAIMCAYNSSWC